MSLEDKIVTLAETVGADVRGLISDKVDKVANKGLSDTNFTQAEKTKLANIKSVSTKKVGIPAHVNDPIDAIDLGVSMPALVSPNEKSGMYARDARSALFSGSSRVEVGEEFVQFAAITEEVESLFELVTDDAIFTLRRGEEFVQYSLKEMFRKLDTIANIPSVPKSSAYIVTATDKGKSIDTTTNVTIPASVFTVGDVIVVTNTSATDSSIIAASGVTFRLAGSDSTGLRTLAGYGVATFRMVSNNVWFASGAGLS